MHKQQDRTLTILLPRLTATASVTVKFPKHVRRVAAAIGTNAQRNSLRGDLIGSYHMRSKSFGLPVVTLTALEIGPVKPKKFCAL